MGLAMSKVDSSEQYALASRPSMLTGERGPGGDSRCRISRTSKRWHGNVEKGLDESQSRSTESTQGSPEIGMYPSKMPRGNRRGSLGSAASASIGRTGNWLRKNLSSGPPKNHKDDSLPPSYLVFKQSALRSPPSSRSAKSSPVPVVRSRTIHPTGDATRWESLSDGELGDHSEAQTDELERIYDLRTWEMYLRITQARKNIPRPTMIPHHRQIASDGKPMRMEDDGYEYYTPGDAALDERDVCTDLSQSDEMIFGDLE